MRKCYWAYLGFLFGLIGLVLLPIGFKAFAFFFPAIFLCIAVNSEKYNFNLLLFLVILFPFLFIPHQTFTFDASNPFDLGSYSAVVSKAAAMVVAFIYFGIPTIFSAMIIWSIIIGKVDAAAKLMLRMVILMGVLIILLALVIIAGYDPTGGMINQIAAFYVSLINLIFSIPIMMYNLIRTIISAYNTIRLWLYQISKGIADFLNMGGNVALSLPRMDNLPSLRGYSISLDSTQQESKTMSYTDHIYAIHDILPITITCICLVTALFMTKTSYEKEIVKKIGEIFGKDKKAKTKRTKIHFPNVDLGMYVMLALILFFGWILFFSYGKNFGHDPRTDYLYLGYFGIYSIIIAVSVVLLTTNEMLFYERSNIKNTVIGTILGVIILKVIMSFFTYQVLDAYSNEELHRDASYIAITFLFIAPAESLFFFVFLPGLVFAIILSKINKNVKIMYESERKIKLAVLDTNIEIYNKMLKNKEIQKKKQMFAWLQLAVIYNQRKRKKIETKEPVFLQQKKAIFGRRNPMILFVSFGVLLPAFAFASLHFPMLNANTGIDYLTFWTCGLGVILFCCGIFFILLSISMGYQSSIWSHAIFNTLTIWMVIICLGV